MSEPVEHHRIACDGFSDVARRVEPSQWDSPTPCSEWDAAALVEHVIGFHDFLLLRPLGIRAHRPRAGPAERWEATSNAMFAVLADDAILDVATELPGGGQSTPRTMLAALTTDVLVHTWDLARAAGVPAGLDDQLCAAAYESARAAGIGTASAMFHAAVAVDPGAATQTKLVALYGRDPAWEPN